MKKHYISTFLGVALALCATAAKANDIGSVDTEFKFVGPNHKIKVSGFSDPKIGGVQCFISRPITGGFMGALGLATDPSDASIACRQTGPIEVIHKIDTTEKGELVMDESRSALFKTLYIQRFY